jgi:hypothetical protein
VAFFRIQQKGAETMKDPEDQHQLMNVAEQEMMQLQKEMMLEAKRMKQEFQLEREKIKSMKEVSLSQTRLPALRDAIQNEGASKRLLRQTFMETFANDDSILSASLEHKWNSTKMTVLRNSNYVSVKCPHCNNEFFEVALQPGRIRQKCRKKLWLFNPPWVWIDVGPDLSVHVSGSY